MKEKGKRQTTSAKATVVVEGKKKKRTKENPSGHSARLIDIMIACYDVQTLLKKVC